MPDAVVVVVGDLGAPWAPCVVSARVVEVAIVIYYAMHKKLTEYGVKLELYGFLD